MIIVKLMGGLGNQMFQYAFGKALETKFKDTTSFDKSWFDQKFENVTPRVFGLDAFNISLHFIDPKRLFFRNPRHSWFKILKQKIKGKIVCQKITEACFSFNQIKPNGNFYLEGYWQNNEYYEGIRKIIVEEFHFPKFSCPEDINLQDMICGCESVAVHIRRGDYVSSPKTNQYHGTCSMKYYKDAVNKILSEIPDVKFFLFTDDPDFVKANFGFLSDSTLVSNNQRSEIDELNLMHLCKHFIIANSSFSWWGAWLSQNPNKIVIAPKQWFNNTEANEKCKIVPKDWIRI
ncbi:alpha-1,2-fucosyltransferase [bacterium]|nr:alpha-1,2-fucosyltransferase [bacterium]